MDPLEGVYRKFIKKTYGKTPEEIDANHRRALKAYVRDKKNYENIRQHLEELLIESRLTKDLLASGVIKAESLFNKLCDDYPRFPYEKIQKLCSRLGMRKRQFATYKERRKAKRRDDREEMPVLPGDRERILGFLA